MLKVCGCVIVVANACMIYQPMYISHFQNICQFQKEDAHSTSVVHALQSNLLCLLLLTAATVKTMCSCLLIVLALSQHSSWPHFLQCFPSSVDDSGLISDDQYQI